MRTAVLLLLAVAVHAQTVLVTGPAAMEYRLFSAALETALEGWRVVQAKEAEVVELTTSAKPRAVILAAACSGPEHVALAKAIASAAALIVLAPPGCNARFDYRAIRVDLENTWKADSEAHFRIAARLLEMLGAAPESATVDVDLLNGAARATHAKVRDVQTGDLIAWTQDESVSLWPLGLARAARRKPGLLLKVAGLTARRYRLSINGQTIGEFGDKELTAGVDLSMIETPMSNRGERLYRRNLESLRQWCTGVRAYNPGLDLYESESHGYELQPL